MFCELVVVAIVVVAATVSGVRASLLPTVVAVLVVVSVVAVDVGVDGVATDVGGGGATTTAAVDVCALRGATYAGGD